MSTSMFSTMIITWYAASGRAREGTFLIRNGTLQAAEVTAGSAEIDGFRIRWNDGHPLSIRLSLCAGHATFGPHATLLHWQAEDDGFTVLPANIVPGTAARVPELGLSLLRDGPPSASPPITPHSASGDELPTGRAITREYWAARNTRPDPVPTVLGLSRDQRLFEVDPGKAGVVRARLDLNVSTIEYDLCRATTADSRCVRSLVDGCLPLLEARHRYGCFEITEWFFASFADRSLDEAGLAGTPLLPAQLFTRGCQLPQELWEPAKAAAENQVPAGEVVLFHRARITHHGTFPTLAPLAFPRATRFTTAHPGEPTLTDVHSLQAEDEIRAPDSDGVRWSGERAFSIHRIDGRIPDTFLPCPLLSPGESMTLDSVLAHDRRGLSATARKWPFSWEDKFAETKAFWQHRLTPPTRFQLPDPHLEHFARAGLGHLELVTLGEEPSGPLLAKVGVYPPIGSESLPMLEYYLSVGRQQTARRCLDAFFDLQATSGRINCFAHYDIETGAALFLAGRYFAYTGDVEWARRRREGIRRAARYVLNQRQPDDAATEIRGLIAGTCADPAEPTTAIMLNAYAAAGVSAAATLLKAAGDAEAAALAAEARELSERFRDAFRRCFTRGPLLPVGVDRWAPTCSPWVEGTGPHVLGLDGEPRFSHRTHFVHDALLGPLSAVQTGLIDPADREVGWLLAVNDSHFNRAAVAESQPYYGRHPEAHLLRGEREAFLNSFYSGLTSLADAETFTFWEHYHHVSIHKTHEEAWALMQLRRMLWLETEPDLRLLAGIPESWVDAGRTIVVEEAFSTYGRFTFRLAVDPSGNSFSVLWKPALHALPASVRFHLPGRMFPPDWRTGRLRAIAGDWIEITAFDQSLEATASFPPA
ncbi:MAG: hypothetical protein EA425_13610 [Puniceicoccaceae bacterium]|nr:MAG: hypothetical protein EA425_13610 [Puniceicoccaceae bacterium]